MLLGNFRFGHCRFSVHVCDGHVNMVGFVVDGSLCHICHVIICVVDCECLGGRCNLPLLVYVAHLSFCCDGDVAAHFVGCESWPPSEVTRVDCFAPGGYYWMDHGCVIEFDELRCCVTLENAVG